MAGDAEVEMESSVGGMGVMVGVMVGTGRSVEECEGTRRSRRLFFLSFKSTEARVFFFFFLLLSNQVRIEVFEFAKFSSSPSTAIVIGGSAVIL